MYYYLFILLFILLFIIIYSLALDRVKWRKAIKSFRHVTESNPCCQGKEGR